MGSNSYLPDTGAIHCRGVICDGQIGATDWRPTSEGYIGGAAYTGKEIAIGFAKPVLASGNDASAHIVTLIAHEAGHMRCANHVTSETLMNTLALGFNPQPRAWDISSLAEMARCHP